MHQAKERPRNCVYLLPFTAACAGVLAILACPQSWAMKWIEAASDNEGFVYRGSLERFIPWGFNYDRDDKMRQIEDYWEREWNTVKEDFQEMKALGANVVRVHLQLGKIMRDEYTADKKTVKKVRRLTKLAERLGLYLDVTGLACYDKQRVPAWYNALAEPERWRVQARFWEAIAAACANSPAVFCYDLMNEPVAPSTPTDNKDWLPGDGFAGKHYVQLITLDPHERSAPAVAQQWIRCLRKAIRDHDQRHMITVGLLPWSPNQPGPQSGFIPQEVAPELDFLSVHLYPESGKVDESLDILRGFAVGKPILVEEMFPLRCSITELRDFVQKSAPTAHGWLGFYWGKTPAEMRASETNADALTLAWLDFFHEHACIVPEKGPNP